MSGILKHGAHRVPLTIPAAAAGTANDTVGHTFVYDAFRNGATTANATPSGIDLASEQVVEATFTTYAVLTGQATNFVSVRLIHRNAAGTTQNDIRVVFSAAGVVTAAAVPANMSVASAATVTGTGTGTLTVTTGTALPWNLTNGDTVTLDRISNNATGLATPAISANLVLATRGA